MRLHVTGVGELILLLAGDMVHLGHNLGLFSHMHALKGAPETVMDYGVHQFCGAHTIAGARLGQEIGCVAHAFHAASDVEVTIASLDGLGGEHNSLEARATDLV